MKSPQAADQAAGPETGCHSPGHRRCALGNGRTTKKNKEDKRMSIEKALAAIEAQQAKESGHTAAWMVGEQLREICLREPQSAELIAQDLITGGMSLQAAERKIKAYADKHRTGNFACVTPAEAERIIREYFGLDNLSTASGPPPLSGEAGTKGKVIDLADFF